MAGSHLSNDRQREGTNRITSGDATVCCVAPAIRTVYFFDTDSRTSSSWPAEPSFVAGVRDELGVFLDEDLARGTEIELAGIVAEELAVDAGPDQAAVGVDVDLGHAELGGGQIFVLVHAAGGRDRACRPPC